MVQTCEMLKHHRWSIISERKKEKKICSSFRQWDWQSLYPITALLKRKIYSCILKSFGSSTTNWAHHAICFFFTFSICDGLKKNSTMIIRAKQTRHSCDQHRPTQNTFAWKPLFHYSTTESTFQYLFLFFFFLSSWPLTFTWAESQKDLELDLSHFSLASHLCRNNDYSTC